MSKPSILLLSAFAPYSFVYESFNGREVITVSIVWTKTVFGVLVELSFLIFALLYDLYGTYRYDYDDNLSINDWDRIWIDIFFLSMKAFLFFISLLLATLLCRPSWNLTKGTAMDPSKPGEMIDISNTKNEVTPSNCIRNVLSQTLITLG